MTTEINRIIREYYQKAFIIVKDNNLRGSYEMFAELTKKVAIALIEERLKSKSKPPNPDFFDVCEFAIMKLENKDFILE